MHPKSLDDLISTCHLMSELVEYGVELSDEEQNEKFLDSIPSNQDSYTKLMKETMEISMMSLEDVIERLQAQDLSKKKKSISQASKGQDHRRYFTKTTCTFSFNSIALYYEDTNDKYSR